MEMQMPTINGRVDETWLDGVLRENATRAVKHAELTPEFGQVCIRFTDAVMNDGNFGFCHFDKITKAEVCSIVYLHLCNSANKYKPDECDNPSNWLYTVVKNRVIDAFKEVSKNYEVSASVAVVVGLETLSKLEGIDCKAPINKVISEKYEALQNFKLNKNVKDSLFAQAWRDSWYRRDNATVLQRARRHNRLQAARAASQTVLSEEERNELKRIIEERRNGRGT